MKPDEPIKTGQLDMFRSELKQIIDMRHPYVVVAEHVNWDYLAEECGKAYSDKPGHPALPTRLMAGLQLLKYAGNHSDEEVLAMWLHSPYYQYFCGAEFFQHVLPLDRSSLTRWRQRMGEEKVAALLKASLGTALQMGAIEPSDLSEVVVDTTVQPKNIAHPTDARLLHKARVGLVRKARAAKIRLRQSYAVVGEKAFQCCTGFNKSESPGKALGSLRNYLGRVVRDIGRKIDGDSVLMEVFKEPLRIAERVRTQRPRDGVAEHVYAAHAPEVECIGKGKRHRPWEFGVKVSVTTPLKKIKGMQLILHAKALPGRPYDGHTLAEVLPDIERITGVPLWQIFVDRGYKGHNAAPEYEGKVIVTGERRNTTPEIRQLMRRRNAVEPVIGHVKNEHRMGRNYLAGSEGDAMNAVLAAAGYNFHLLFRWAKAFLRLFPVRRILVDQFNLTKCLIGLQGSLSPSPQIR